MKPCRKPCSNCPFRSDLDKRKAIILGRARMEEIVESVTTKDKSFQCHKTIGLQPSEERFCAGALLFTHHADGGKHRNANFLVRLLGMGGEFNEEMSDIEGKDKVFNSSEELLKFHSGQ